MTTPPRAAERLLALTVRDPEWRDGILGDLAEEFQVVRQRRGGAAARRWYWAQALGLTAHRLTAGRPTRRRSPPPPPEPRTGRAALLLHDLRSAWRSVLHQPALSLTVVAILGLSLAANAAVFALADAIVLRPFRYPGTDAAVVIASTPRERFFDRESVAPGDLQDWRAGAGDVLDQLAAAEWWSPQFLSDGPPQELSGFKVSPELFTILGEAPALGRTLTADDVDSETPAVVLGHDFWHRQFGGRPEVIGQTLRLGDRPYVVVGVMPPTFRVPYGADVWAPLRLAPDVAAGRGRGWLIVVGGMAPGVTPAQVDARLQAILADQRRAFPGTHETREVSVYTFRDGMGDPGAGPFILVWQVAAIVLLLVACANVTNLLLARNTEREREFSVRLALGASGARLARQLVVEGLLLAGAATALALPLAHAAVGAVRSTFPDSVVRFVPGWAYMDVQPRTLLATAALAALAVLLFAVAPAVRASRQDVASGLRPGARLTGGTGRQRVRWALACAQLALTLALLVAAGLSLAALDRVTGGPLGFVSDNVLAGRVSPPDQRYADPESRRQLAAKVVARLEQLPAVRRAAATSALPYSGSDFSSSFWREDVPPREADAVRVSRRRSTPGTFEALGIPLLEGRLLSSADRADTPPVAVVSRMLADRQWPAASALGKRFRIEAGGPLIEVVGVVGDVAHHWLVEPLRPTVYQPFDQDPPSGFHIVVKAVTAPAQLTAGLRAAVQAEDPELPVVGLRTMEKIVEDQTAGLRFAGRTLGVIAAISGLLSAVGIYSLMAFLAGRRTREMGVRMALGATAGDLVRLSCVQALRLIAAGTAIGLGLAYLVGRALESAMFGVVSTSAVLTGSLAAALAVTALAASYIPARRIARLDPTEALRAE